MIMASSIANSCLLGFLSIDFSGKLSALRKPTSWARMSISVLAQPVFVALGLLFSPSFRAWIASTFVPSTSWLTLRALSLIASALTASLSFLFLADPEFHKKGKGAFLLPSSEPFK